MNKLHEVVVVAASRTAIGAFQGALKDIPAPKLGSTVIKDLLRKTGLDNNRVDEVIMGNVLTANVGQAPARQAALFAGLSNNTQCLTINKVCGSGLKSIMLATQAIMVGDAEIVIAGGMENMSQTPFYVSKMREGHKLGHSEIIDGMIKDGLWDVYNNFHMGNAADKCAESCAIPRQAQDTFAEMSFKRAQLAQEKGLFKDEIAALEVMQKKGTPTIFDTDEGPGKANFEKMKTLRPAFSKDGTVTAANASSINDGAAAVMLMSYEKATELGLQPLAKIVAQASSGRTPEEFTTAPTDATIKALKKANLDIKDIDLFEINEAFAVVALVNNQKLNIPLEKVNINGGAIALGHPIGASGARIFVTLLHAMNQNNAKRGLASICIGGGEASTLIVERI